MVEITLSDSNNEELAGIPSTDPGSQVFMVVLPIFQRNFYAYG